MGNVLARYTLRMAEFARLIREIRVAPTNGNSSLIRSEFISTPNCVSRRRSIPKC